MHAIRFQLIAGMLLVSALCASDAWAQAVPAPAKLVTPGKLNYGTVATFAPFEYQEGDKLVGLDIDLSAALAAKMGLKSEPLAMDFKGLIPALQSGRIDVVIAGLYITPAREEQIDFVPYIKIANQLVVRKGNPKKIRSRDDLCGTTIGVTLGGFQETYAREDAKRCADARRPEVTVLTFPSAQDAALAVSSGRADVLFNSTPGAVKQATEQPDKYEMVGDPFGADTKLGVGVRKGDADTKRAIEAALKLVVADGTYAKLLDKYRMPKWSSMFGQ